MRTRICAIALGICVVGLAACNNGGGTTPTPVNTSFRPAASGDAFGYAGTMTEAFVRAPLGAGEITPSPNPTNSQTLTSAVTQSVAVSGGATFQGVPGAFDFHINETDTLQGGLKTSTASTDEYYTYTTSGGSTTIDNVGSNETTSDGSTFLTVIGSGNGLTDILPEVSGTLTPANTAAETVSETDADGSTDVRTTASDGTYTEAGDDAVDAAFGTTMSTQATLNADGSGSYSFPLIIPEESSYTVSAPSGGNITVTVTFPSDLLGGGPEPGPLTVPVWYPQPLVIASDSIVDNGASSLPAACNVSSSLAKTPHELVETKTSVDPVFGETDAQTTTTFTEKGLGVTCIELSDVVNQYYDLSGQSQFLLFFDNVPVQTTTTTETLGITSATVLGLTSVERNASRAALQAGVARFHAHLVKRRLERRAAFRTALAARFKLKGGHL